ncbi:hypothetical protein EPO33_01930 [Patescibacteria group bacterium]|nr:MAG: hypothetical protein EPO33_01930 [Patescibacteria group bacterium]
MPEMQEHVPQDAETQDRWESGRPTPEDFRAKMELYVNDARAEANATDRLTAKNLMVSVARKFDEVAAALNKHLVQPESGQYHGIMFTQGWKADDYRTFADMLRERAETEYPEMLH